MDKKTNTILYLGIILPIFLIISFGVFKDSNSETRSDRFYRDRRNIEFHGVIDSIYKQRDNHNIMTALSGQSIFEIEGLWESKFKLGDLVIKEKDNLYVKIFRDGMEIDSLSYLDILRK